MDKLISSKRLALLIGIFVVMSVIIVISLYRLQIIEGAEYYEESQNTINTTVTVADRKSTRLNSSH